MSEPLARVSVLLVEDDPVTRDGLATAIAGHPRCVLLDSVGDIAAGRRALDALAPDVLLVDLGLPDGDGVELISAARHRRPHCDAMVITSFGDERNVMRAIRAGAAGYLLKDALAERVPEAVLQLADGGSPISPAIARHLLRTLQPTVPESDAEAGLTGREQEILAGIAKGYTAPELGRMLAVSHHTVATHVKRIYRKLEVHSRGEAIHEARIRGLLDGPG